MLDVVTARATDVVVVMLVVATDVVMPDVAILDADTLCVVM